MFCGIDNILKNILLIYIGYENISNNNVSPTEHCCGFEYGNVMWGANINPNDNN